MYLQNCPNNIYLGGTFSNLSKTALSMRYIFFLIGLLLCHQSFSQAVLGPMRYNPKLYYGAAAAHHVHHPLDGRHRNFVMVEDSNILVESDTLSLPFVDDFTRNLLKPYNFAPYIYDTVYNAIGPCDTSWGVSTITDSFALNQTYTYAFDTTHHQVDSTPNTAILFYNSTATGSNCFYYLGDTAHLYPRGYLNTFDSATGAITAQIFDTSDVVVGITYAPVLYKAKLPAYALWMDNNAWQNYTYPYLPPTLGVASFDGLAADGQPYNNSSPTNWGLADILTSKPIDMGGLVDDDSVYFSFFYQPGGMGDCPTFGDSLVLQFYNGQTNNWDEIWSVHGDSVIPFTPDPFRQVLIRIPTTTLTPPVEYMFKGFQFRFLNYGSLTGNNDVWNIDYVRLNSGRTFTDTAISDLAYQNPFPSILKNFSEMPAEQFSGLDDIADTLAFSIANLNQPQAVGNPPATNYSTVFTQVYPNPAALYSSTSATFNAGLENYVYLYPSTEINAPAGAPFDSLVIAAQCALTVPDILPANDTVSRVQTLSNTLAYDDGSAEYTFGIQNLGTNKFAYDFTLHYPDTLVGFQVMYGQTDANVSDLVFNFNLWYRLDTSSIFFVDSPVFVSNNFTPFYIDSVNGFATYKVGPLPLPTHFYFGWAQTDVRNLQIGFDANSTKGNSHMLFYSTTTGIWQPVVVNIPGSPMIRLLLGHSYQIPSAVGQPQIRCIKAYPNPSSGALVLELPETTGNYTAAFYNLMGQLAGEEHLAGGNSSLNLAGMSNGLYLLRLTDSQSGTVYQAKIIKVSEH